MTAKLAADCFPATGLLVKNARSSMPQPQHYQVSSALRASPENLWRHIASLDGVNEELWPLRMSGPRELLGENVPLNQPLFRSVVSLFGLVALDLHEFQLQSVEAGRGFHECSRSLMEKRWEHIRTIAPEPGGCVVTDELAFEPRLLFGVIGGVIKRGLCRRHVVVTTKL